MALSYVTVDKNLKEQISHGSYSFPVDVHSLTFQADGEGAPSYFVCHWHPETEFMLLLSGEMRYQVNETVYNLKEGDGLFINSNCLHMGTAVSRQAVSLSVIFHPRFLYGYEDSLIREKYISPILDSSCFDTFSFPAPEEESCQSIPALLRKCLQLCNEKPPVWEMHMKSILLSCWASLYTAFSEKKEQKNIPPRRREATGKAKIILAFIQENYTAKITLADIAKAASLSPGECGRICKRMLHQSPFEYLNAFRVEQSLPDLLGNSLSITEVALKHGFSGSSYYAETFKKAKGVTPSHFRRALTQK